MNGTEVLTQAQILLQEWSSPVVEWYHEHQDWFSPVFPTIWLALPVFVLSCFVVQWWEGKDKQPFNMHEFSSSIFNNFVLGSLTSCGPIMKYVLDPNKTTMEPFEFLWKLVFFVLMVDVVFYFLHRWMHENKTAYRWMHSKHHALGASNTVWGALDDDFLEVLTIFGYLTLPFLFISVTPEFYILVFVGGAAQSAMIHGSHGNFPPWPLCNADFHRGHHINGSKNFAATLVVLDEWFGTKRIPRSRGSRPSEASVPDSDNKDPATKED